MSTDPDQIRSEIEQTQRELSADVDALTDKISPQRIVERRVRGTRTAMTNVKDRIMGSTSDAYQTAGSAASGVRESAGTRVSAARDTVAGTASSAVDTVRSAPDTARRSTQGNPLAAGLIAFGAGWLLSALLRRLLELLGCLLAGLAELFGHRAALLRGEVLDLARDPLLRFAGRQQRGQEPAGAEGDQPGRERVPLGATPRRVRRRADRVDGRGGRASHRIPRRGSPGADALTHARGRRACCLVGVRCAAHDAVLHVRHGGAGTSHATFHDPLRAELVR